MPLLAALLLLPTLLLPPASAHAAPVLQLQPSSDRIDLIEHVDLLADPAPTLGIDTVTAAPYRQQFAPLQRDATISHDGAIWLRFALHNTSDQTLLRVVDVQLGADFGPVALYREGAPPEQLPLLQHSPRQFLLQLAPHASALYYLHLRPDGITAPALQLLSVERFVHDQGQQRFARGLAWGLQLALIAALLIAALRHRSTLYLWLVAEGLLPQLALWLLPLASSWRPPLIALCLLLSSGCALRISLRLGALPTGSRWRRLFTALAVATLMAPLLLWVASPVALAIAIIIPLQLLIGGASLLAYLLEHRRGQLGYALVRLGQLLLGSLLLLYLQTAATPALGAAASVMLIGTGCGLLLMLLVLAQQRALAVERNAQRGLVAVAEAESRTRAEVIAEVGHRVRTPVSGVLGMLEMLQDTPLTPVQRDYLGTIQRAGNELLNAVNDLSDVTRLEARRSGLEQTRFDLSALVAETLDGFRGLAANRGLELITDLAPALPPLVSGDPTRLRQILLQLMHHAINSCGNGEVVLQVGPAAQRDRLQFRLLARGSAPADASSPIERRINQPAPNLRPAVARQLVEMLGGNIELQPGADGLAVRFELPLPALDPAGLSDSGDSTLRNCQLLVIDDNPTFCEMLRRQASHWGMAVQTAASVAEALAWLRTQATIGHRVDLILADAELPELAEEEWFGRLLDTATPAPVLILLCSQPTLPDDERLRALGVRRLLTKPINQTSLRLTLEEELAYAEQPRPAPATPNRAPLRCLVAEDNVINARVLLGMLEKLGAQATVVNNGQQAVEAIQRQSFDIVLMDCDMPIMDGFEAAKRIREVHGNRGLAPVPIIALTANTLEELGERARQPVMDAHLVKPIHLRELRELLERWSGRTVEAAAPP